MKTIYNCITGESIQRDHVDARELLATGRWRETEPTQEEMDRAEESFKAEQYRASEVKPRGGNKPTRTKAS